MSAPADLLFEGIGRGVSALAAAADPDLPELLHESEGRRLALVVRGTGRCLEIEVRDGALRILPPRRIREEEFAAGAEGAAAGAQAQAEEAAAGPPPPGDDRPEAGAPPIAGEAGAPGPAPGEAGAAAGGEGAGGSAERPAGADLVLAGSVPDFLRFLGALRREPPSGDLFGGLEAHGSPDARAGFVRLLRRIEPDYEALLARAAGGVVAHAVSRTALGRLLRARRSAARLVDDLAEYLEEEARIVPDAPARTRFAGGVRALIDKAADLEERLDRVR